MSVIKNNFKINSEEYQATIPYPYTMQDDFLDNDFAAVLQREILEIPEESWDRYDNPFEQKYTLRDKFKFPDNLNKLFAEFESREFIEYLSQISGYRLLLDPTRNFWGVHKYKTGDKLDIHMDAGLHPTTKQKKQVTLGLYLSSNWKEEYGCQFEVWHGDNAVSNDAKIYEKIESISPLYNRAIMFNCNDYSWHGNPVVAECPRDATRIFITLSYLSDNTEDKNKRVKAFFVPRPEDPADPEKDRLRFLRADPEKYNTIYRTIN
jgi:hypothetical protein